MLVLNEPLVEGEHCSRNDEGDFTTLIDELQINAPVKPPRKLRIAAGSYTWENEETGGAVELVCSQVKRSWKLVLPAGYYWDGLSAPWFARALGVGKNNKKTLRASLHHDAMYEGLRSYQFPPPLPRDAEDREKRRKRRWKQARKWADDSMLQLLKEDRCSRVKRWLMYFAVRKFGAGAAKP